MSALNAAPNQSPFAFECKEHYRTVDMNFGQCCINLGGLSAIIRFLAPGNSIHMDSQYLLRAQPSHRLFTLGL